MTKQDSIKELRRYLSRLFNARHDGTETVSYAKDQGFVDGYMQALSDLAAVEDRELLRVISEERNRAAERAEKPLGALRPSAAVEHFA